MKFSNHPKSQEPVDSVDGASDSAVSGNPDLASGLAPDLASDVAVAEAAVALLLRSPRLSISTIMDLMDLGDSELRAMAQRNERIRKLLDARRDGQLPQAAPKDLIPCAGCGELLVPYAGRGVCSDTCERIRQVQSDKRRQQLHHREQKS